MVSAPELPLCLCVFSLVAVSFQNFPQTIASLWLLNWQYKIILWCIYCLIKTENIGEYFCLIQPVPSLAPSLSFLFTLPSPLLFSPFPISLSLPPPPPPPLPFPPLLPSTTPGEGGFYTKLYPTNRVLHESEISDLEIDLADQTSLDTSG